MNLIKLQQKFFFLPSVQYVNKYQMYIIQYFCVVVVIAAAAAAVAAVITVYNQLLRANPQYWFAVFAKLYRCYSKQIRCVRLLQHNSPSAKFTADLLFFLSFHLTKPIWSICSQSRQQSDKISFPTNRSDSLLLYFFTCRYLL